MKVAVGVAWKIYWLIVAGIPLIPPQVLFRYQSVLTCYDNGICFRSGHPYLNSEGMTIVYISIFLLWPMCAWQLIGRHIFRGRWLLEFRNRARLGKFAVLAAKIYWSTIAMVPLLFWYLFGTFQAPFECIENRDCFKFFTPLDAVSLTSVLLSCCLLWPMCFLKLFGKKLDKSAPSSA